MSITYLLGSIFFISFVNLWNGGQRKSGCFDYQLGNSQGFLIHVMGNVMVIPFTVVRRGVPVREDTYPEP